MTGSPTRLIVENTGEDGSLVIGKLLGHTQVQTTARYAHLADDPVQAAANRIASRISAIAG